MAGDQRGESELARSVRPGRKPFQQFLVRQSSRNTVPQETVKFRRDQARGRPHHHGLTSPRLLCDGSIRLMQPERQTNPGFLKIFHPAGGPRALGQQSAGYQSQILSRPRSESGRLFSTIRWIWSGCNRVLKCEAMITSFSNRSARSIKSSRWVWPNLWISDGRSFGATNVISRIKIWAW